MKQGMSLTELAAEVERQAAAKMDFVANTDALVVVPEFNPATGDRSRLQLNVNTEDNGRLRGASFDVGPTAHDQFSDRLGIPKKYYDRMLTSAPGLLAANVNHWLHAEPSRRMVRTLDGKVRAFLSDHYQRRDNFDLMQFLLPVLMQTDETGMVPWRFESQALTPDRLYLKLVHTHSMAITTKRGVDDRVHAGVAISNSEIGTGALRVEPLVWWKVCMNGAIMTKYSMRKVHLGGRQGGDDPVALMLSDQTKQLEDAAYFAKARDVVAYFANPETFAGIVREIEQTTGREIVGKVERGVEVLGNMIGLQSIETEGVLRNLINSAERNGLTQYGLLNAVTAMAQTVEDYGRATRIEEAAATIIDLQPSEWRQIAEAA